MRDVSGPAAPIPEMASHGFIGCPKPENSEQPGMVFPDGNESELGDAPAFLHHQRLRDGEPVQLKDQGIIGFEPNRGTFHRPEANGETRCQVEGPLPRRNTPRGSGATHRLAVHDRREFPPPRAPSGNPASPSQTSSSLRPRAEIMTVNHWPLSASLPPHDENNGLAMSAVPSVSTGTLNP